MPRDGNGDIVLTIEPTMDMFEQIEVGTHRERHDIEIVEVELQEVGLAVSSGTANAPV